MSSASNGDLRKPPSPQAWYAASIADFLQMPPPQVIGALAGNCDFAVLPTQRDAWLVQLEVLARELPGVQGNILLEFSIPRMGRRIDAVLLVGPIVFAIEFKVGEATFHRAAYEQVWDYALDLKNFHEASHAAAIVPILVGDRSALDADHRCCMPTPDQRLSTDRASAADGLRDVIDHCVARHLRPTTSIADAWRRSSYRPTPTIIEAARALYAHHSVEAIARFDAGAENLRLTSQRIDELVDRAMADARR